MESLISRTMLRSNYHILSHFVMTLTLFVIAILPVSQIVKANPPPQLQPGQSQQGLASPGADITAGFLQLHPNGYPGDEKDARRDDEDRDEDYSSLAAVLMPDAARTGGDTIDGKRVDPRGSWLSFVRHSSKASDKKCEKDKNKKSSRALNFETAGPPGPPGPMGPPGPPGAEVTKEELLEEFRELITEAAERRAQILIQERCPSCVANSTQTWLPEISDLQILPQLPIAFHCKLLKGVEIHKKSLTEISNFQTPFADGSFKKGVGLDVKSGRFTAPRTAIYQFFASLHINHPVSKKRMQELKFKDHIRLLICIDSLCHRHTSLEYISGMESNSRVFTITVSGLLKLQIGQYASVYVDNSSSRTILVQSGSDFTGLLMGV
ncbi:adipolin-like [Amphiura filiformis]|uniref:adipolin-like n=1 Tax=Amphiura filiformis TaxID=82378 RepID=UPI003B20C061